MISTLILHRMQLRNGKTIVNTPKIVTTNMAIKVNPVEMDPVVLFVQEAKSLLDEVDEWDVTSARVAGLLEFYQYVNEYMLEFKNDPRMASFITAIKKGVPCQMQELGGIIQKNGHDMEILQTIGELMHEMFKLVMIVK